MKNCKSCTKEIDDKATKCPYCQSYQIWHKSPQIYGLIFPLIFIPIIFYTSGLYGIPKFENYKDQISASLISERIVDEQKILNFNITNKSNVIWNDISYIAIGYDKNGGVVVSSSGNEFRWLLPSNGSAMLSVKVSKDEQISKWDFQISSLKKDRF